MLQALCSENLIFNKDLFAERSGTEGELGNKMTEIVNGRRKLNAIFKINFKSITIKSNCQTSKKSYTVKLI